jgi:hypothetical protein
MGTRTLRAVPSGVGPRVALGVAVGVGDAVGDGVFVDVAVGTGVGVALLVGDAEAVGLALGVGGGVEEGLESAELAPAAGAAAPLSGAGAAQLVAPSPITITSRKTTSHL